MRNKKCFSAKHPYWRVDCLGDKVLSASYSVLYNILPEIFSSIGEQWEHNLSPIDYISSQGCQLREKKSLERDATPPTAICLELAVHLDPMRPEKSNLRIHSDSTLKIKLQQPLSKWPSLLVKLRPDPCDSVTVFSVFRFFSSLRNTFDALCDSISQSVSMFKKLGWSPTGKYWNFYQPLSTLACFSVSFWAFVQLEHIWTNWRKIKQTVF